MAGSSSERLIRDYTASRLREMLPAARIVHELVVGTCRADLAAVEPERVTLVEIKSERDTLGRLVDQAKQFGEASHQFIVVAHERWFDTTPYTNGRPRFVPSAGLRDSAAMAEIWAFPETARPEPGLYARWTFPRHWAQSPCPEPHAAKLLGLLWRQELLAEAARHRISAGSRTNMMTLIRDMAWLMSGKEIARAVCRQLRLRHFPEADAPIVEIAEAA